MASKSRWADTEEDAAYEAKIRREKEEKKRLKAEKARKAEEAQRAQAEAEAAKLRAAQEQQQNQDDRPPAKRRKLTPEGEGQESGGAKEENNNNNNAKLLRFEAGTWGKSRSVENYDKLNDIEEGAYGWVARAKEIKTGKVVALKRLKIDPNDAAGLPETGLREIQILKDCSHRNIVELREVVVGDDTSRIENVFLVLEFLEHDLMSVLGDMPEPFLASEVKTLLLQLAGGVAYLHDHWILHRDLKTSNLLLNNRGQLKIADFGMARYVGDPPPPKLTQLVVTLWYRAPELLLGTKTYGAAVDMWSVGCIFGELLTREPLLQGKTEADELTKIFELCGIPSDDSWPGFRRLPNARHLRLPKASAAHAGSVVRARFPLLTTAGCDLLSGLLSLDPDRRPTAREMLQHEYFRQDPKPKHEAMFPTFPSKAGQERRRRRSTPNAPGRGQKAAELGAVDFSGIFAAREKEERGGGFALRMV
ncbi:kinase-like protein [Annulohypoxylon truncatum]|uniref:kinase-like protein n=1 Tax=Annulohypoxylon truncatum TaxID=327061 RepID=UPI002007DD17|nr:kinase-like protein [Annulohypoxylon truncatum]KAI1212285.1 kinase-like protein [Annulohypoxylon truncatum]